MPVSAFTVLTAVFALIVARCAAIQKHGFKALVGGAIGGIAGVGLVAVLSPLTGISLALNRLTFAAATILGLPGTILMVVLKLVLK